MIETREKWRESDRGRVIERKRERGREKKKREGETGREVVREEGRRRWIERDKQTERNIERDREDGIEYRSAIKLSPNNHRLLFAIDTRLLILMSLYILY